MCDKVIINYQLFMHWKNLVQKHEKNEQTMLFLWFFNKIWEMNGNFYFSECLYCWCVITNPIFCDVCAEQGANFQLTVALCGHTSGFLNLTSLMITFSKLQFSIVLGQKQPFRGILRKKCSENMHQIYRRTPNAKWGFNKCANQLAEHRTGEHRTSICSMLQYQTKNNISNG